MNIFAKNESRKNTKISFRTDDETLAHLKSICRIENKTISSLIESILAEHVLVHENPLLIEQEKRLSPRKKCSIPAVVVFKTNNTKKYFNSIIVSLSSNSAQIILKNNIYVSKMENSFYILFNLPKNDYPLLFECTLVKSKCIDGECIIILNFANDTNKNSEILQKFLTLNELSGDF